MNPKDIIGQTKPSLSAIPFPAVYAVGRAMQDGEKKYGRFNWREHNVNSDVYIDAAMRHLLAWNDGEDVAEDSGCNHLAHAAACLMILIDADFTDSMNDQRPTVKTGNIARYIKENTL